MGAYYEKQLRKEKGTKNLILNYKNLNHKYVGLEFFEHAYVMHPYTQLMYYILKTESDKNNKIIVNTICDYNYIGDFKYMEEWGTKNTQKFKKDFFKDYDKFDKIKDIIMGENQTESMEYYTLNGCIVNESKKEYIDLSAFVDVEYKKRDEEAEARVIDPIALLTRFSTECRGGGDIYFGSEKLTCMGDKELRYIASWKDTPLYYMEEDDYDLSEYEDISNKVFYILEVIPLRVLLSRM